MPKPETDIEYHVSLRSPIFLKLGEKLVGVRSFDATIGDADRVLVKGIVFKTDRIWPAGSLGAIRDGVSLKTNIEVLDENIAGMVPQPFVER